MEGNRKRPPSSSSSTSSCSGLLPLVKNSNDHDKPGTNFQNDNQNSIILLDPHQLSSDDGLVIGRVQLLSAVKAACGCSSGKDGSLDTTLPPRNNNMGHNNNHQGCKDCQEIFQWAAYALSRRLLRFTTKKTDGTGHQLQMLQLQVRGTHAAVAVNGTKVDDFTRNSRRNDDHDHDPKQWSHPPMSLQSGAILRIWPRSSSGSDVADDRREKDERFLSFQVVKVRMETTNNSSDDSQTQQHDLLQPETQALHDNGKENGRPTKKKAPDETTSVSNSTKPQQQRQPKPQSPPKLFFVPTGNDFYKRRREILTSNLQKMGCIFVQDVTIAEYIVVSGKVTSLDRMAEACKVERKELEEFLRKGSIPLLLPQWADDCIHQKQLQLPPGRKYAWPHFSTHTVAAAARRSREKSDQDETAHQRKRAKSDPATAKKKPFPKNVKCAEIFKRLSNLHKEMQLFEMDHWRSYCFRLVAGRLLHLDFEVDTDQETLRRLREIPGFGKSAVEKIEEILETGTLQRLHSFQEDPERVAMRSLTDIWGVGPSKAKTLMALKYRDISDVREGLRKNSGIQKLSFDRNQMVGVDCYEDIMDRMPRSEVEQIKEIVEKTAQRMYPGIEVTVQGSYRRGKETCGDVDIHLTHPSHPVRIPDTMLGEIIDALWAEGCIAFHLTTLNGMTKGLKIEDFERNAVSVPSAAWRSTKPAKRYFVEEDHKSFWMGCFFSPVKKNTRRRVDIKLYPYRERAFATVYFTGNGFLNRSMRLWSKRVFSWRLSDHGLFDIATGKRVKEATTEREIFDHLKLVYKEPHERDSFDALESKEGVLDDNMQLSERELEEDNKHVWVE